MLLPRFIRTLFLFFMLTLLSACNDNAEENNSDKTTQLDKAEIVLSEAGIGSINAQTPFNIHIINQAFQDHDDYHVEQFQTKAEGIDYPVIRVLKNTDTLLLINPALDQKKIFSIVVKDKRVGNSLGHKLGMEYGAIYSYGNLEQCSAGAESLSGKVICYAPKSANVLYMFGDKAANTFPDGALPPADALDSWVLEAIIWKPKK